MVVNVLLGVLLLLLLAAGGNAQYSYCSRTYNSSSGTIRSPNHPSSYDHNSNCVYAVTAPLPSAIVFTIRVLALESAERCTFDWIEVSCNSSTNHSSVPVRYCGYAYDLTPVVLLSCSRAVVTFRSDGSVSLSGFLIDYSVVPGCGENCSLNSTGCPVDCVRPSQYRYQYQYQYCICRMPSATDTTSSSPASCPSGCFYEYNFYGQRTCRCPQLTTEAQCPYGCTRRTNWYGYVTCDCNVTTTDSATSPCPYGCFNDWDFWGNRFCNCRASTQPPIWCSPGCTSAVNAYGQRYCQCRTTTVSRCSSPCYMRYDHGQHEAYCYCPPTSARTSVCGRTVVDPYGIITSPNYPSLSSSPQQGDCYQYISISGATSMKIQLLDVDLYSAYSYYCSNDYIQITGCDGVLTTSFCSLSSLPSTTLEFRCSRYSTSQTTVQFHPQPNNYYNDRIRRGFKMVYSVRYSSNCSDSGVYLTEGSNGAITSPNYPSSFTDYTQCTNYLYTDQQGLRIRIEFEQLRLESYSTCREVFLVLTCEDGDRSINRTVCGYTSPPAMTFNCRTLKVYFRTDHLSYRFSPRAFRLRYYATKVIGDQTTYSYVATKPMNTYTLGMSLGVGGGGLFLVILVTVMVVIVVSYRRQMAKMEQRHLQELTVLCRNMRENGSGAGTGADVTFSRGSGGGGAPNGLSYDLLAFDPPPYVHPVLNGAGGGGEAGGAGGGGGAGGAGGEEEDPEHPQAHLDSDEALLLP